MPEIKPSRAAFQSSYAGFFEGIHFNIIPVTAATSLVTADEIAVFDNTVDSIKLPANSAANYALYNIDFDDASKLTIKEVIEGIGAIIEVDLNIALYPTGTASKLLCSEYFTDKNEEIEFSTFKTFKNCTFTSLVNKIEFVTVPTGPFYVGNTIDLEVQLKNEMSNSFTIANVLNEDINKNSSNDEVPLAEWFSSDTSVTTIDSNGVVAPFSPGTFKIVAKAIDAYNNGEIEKPYLVIDLTFNKLSVIKVQYKDKLETVISPETQQEGKAEDAYTTTALVIPVFTFKEIIGQSTGTYSEDEIEVIYIYTKNIDPKKSVEPPKSEAVKKVDKLPQTGIGIYLIAGVEALLTGTSLIFLYKGRKLK